MNDAIKVTQKEIESIKDGLATLAIQTCTMEGYLLMKQKELDN